MSALQSVNKVYINYPPLLLKFIKLMDYVEVKVRFTNAIPRQTFNALVNLRS